MNDRDDSFQSVIAQLEAQAQTMETRATRLRAMADELRELSGRNPVGDHDPVSAGGNIGTSRPVLNGNRGLVSAANRDRPSIASAVIATLRHARRPMAVREIADRLAAQGFHSGLSYERRRVSVVGAVKRRKDVRSLGGGTYVYVGADASPGHRHLHHSTAGGAPTVVDLVRGALAASPGITSTELADLVVPNIRSAARDRRKLVHSVLNYLNRSHRIRREDGRIYLTDETTENSNGGPELEL